MIIVLNGCSSSGKTTLARAIQSRATNVYLNWSIDGILDTVPERLRDRMLTGKPLQEVEYSDLVRAYYACLRQLANLGHPLISDNAVTSRAHAELLVEALGDHQALLVGVDCSAVTLADREAARGDRRAGLARSQQPAIHRWLHYDVFVDSESGTPDANAEIVLAAAAARKQESQSPRTLLREI